MTILLIEDDPILGAAIVDGVAPYFRVEWHQTLADGEAAIAANRYDLLILDLMLPDGSGLDLLGRLRARSDPLPVLVLSARDAVADRLAGLNRGADDYLPKPFDLNELVARCNAILRRSQGRANPAIAHRGLVFDPTAHTVTLDGEPVALSAREYAVLEVLITNAGRVVSKAQIEEQLYSCEEQAESNTVEVHISKLRRKIGPEMIRTIRGLGYVMTRTP
jgi:DNA-binding response OmpR family regulator